MRPESRLAPMSFAALFALAALLTAPAHAAESYDGCKYEVTSLPATLSSQGVWCLKGDLATSITSGAAIAITANNVTLDCNHAKLSGVAAGSGTMAFGIHVVSRSSTTIRNCNVRGFYYGIYVFGSDATLVEDNQFGGNTATGVVTNGTSFGTIVRDNRIVDTGGSTTATTAIGIQGTNDIHAIGNFIAGLAGDGVGNASVFGIYISDGSGTTTGNRISDLVPDGTGTAYGIYSGDGTGHVIDGNVVNGAGGAAVSGVVCNPSVAVARDNVLVQVDVGVDTCEDVGNHVTLD
jgi:parallel beta-helix repeat protein